MISVMMCSLREKVEGTKYKWSITVLFSMTFKHCPELLWKSGWFKECYVFILTLNNKIIAMLNLQEQEDSTKRGVTGQDYRGKLQWKRELNLALNYKARNRI